MTLNIGNVDAKDLEKVATKTAALVAHLPDPYSDLLIYRDMGEWQLLLGIAVDWCLDARIDVPVEVARYARDGFLTDYTQANVLAHFADRGITV